MDPPTVTNAAAAFENLKLVRLTLEVISHDKPRLSASNDQDIDFLPQFHSEKDRKPILRCQALELKKDADHG